MKKTSGCSDQSEETDAEEAEDFRKLKKTEIEEGEITEEEVKPLETG